MLAAKLQQLLFDDVEHQRDIAQHLLIPGDPLAQLGELFSESGIRPIGFAVVGTARPTRGESRYYADKRETFAIPGSGQAGETGG